MKVKHKETKGARVDDQPEVVAAAERLANARNQQDRAQAEVDKLLAEIRASSGGGQDEATALLHGRELDPGFQDQLGKAHQKTDAWRRAVRAGEQEFQTARSTAAHVLLREEKPALMAAQAKLMQALFQWVQAVDEYKSQVNDHQARGLPVVPEIYTGNPLSTDYAGSMAVWTRHLIDTERLRPEDVPKIWREKWGIK